MGVAYQTHDRLDDWIWQLYSKSESPLNTIVNHPRLNISLAWSTCTFDPDGSDPVLRRNAHISLLFSKKQELSNLYFLCIVYLSMSYEILFYVESACCMKYYTVNPLQKAS